MISIGDFARMGGRPALTTVGVSAIAASATSEDVGPIIRALYPRLLEQLGKAGVAPVGPSVAYYSPAPEQSEDALRVQATFPVGVDSVDGLDTVRMPSAEVASLIHRGSMDGIDATYQARIAPVRPYTRGALSGR